MDLVIIGGGPAGLSAAIRAKEEGIDDLLLIERNDALGGILNQCIHHGFGLHVFKEELTGPEYAGRLIERARALGVRFETGAMVTDISPDKAVTYVTPHGLRRVDAKAVILAMGCRERPRGALGIPGGRGAGIYSAGTAQAFVNMKGYSPGKRIVILGSGDIGLIMARRLTLEGAKVLGVYELMPYSGGLKRNIAQCLDDYGIPLYLSHTVTHIKGQERVEGVYIAKVDDQLRPLPETEHYLPCDTLLLSVGLIPENELSKNIGVAMSPVTGGAVVNNRLETNIPGVFSCGNVLHVHDLADNVTLESYAAASQAVRYIRGEHQDGTKIPLSAGSGVRYVMPSTYIYTSGEENRMEISFRSDNVYKKATIQVHADGKLIKTAKKRIVTPGEMEKTNLILTEAAKQITVTVTSEAGGEQA